MPTPTYIPLATVTLGSSASSVTFSSIPATYRDLIVICDYSNTAGAIIVRFNGDSGSNYAGVRMQGGANTTVASSAFTTTQIPPSTGVGEPAGTRSMLTLNIMDYMATDKHKTILTKFGNANSSATGHIQYQANRYISTSAITTILLEMSGGTFTSGSRFDLYGIAS